MSSLMFFVLLVVGVVMWCISTLVRRLIHLHYTRKMYLAKVKALRFFRYVGYGTMLITACDAIIYGMSCVAGRYFELGVSSQGMLFVEVAAYMSCLFLYLAHLARIFNESYVERSFDNTRVDQFNIVRPSKFYKKVPPVDSEANSDEKHSIAARVKDSIAKLYLDLDAKDDDTKQ